MASNMNFSVYFCLVAVAILVVFAQKSEADAIFGKITNSSVDPSIKLKEGYFNGTQILLSSKSKILDGVLAAAKLVGKNPEGARKLTQQSLVDGESIIYAAGPPIFEAMGEALGLSNGGARQGLLSASKFIQKGGLALLNTLNSGESLFKAGSEAGGSAAKASLNVYQSAIETGFAALFYDVQKSKNESLQALRDAQSSPIQLRIENRSCGGTAKHDPECSDALEDINQVAKNALRNGGNPALVQELEEIVKCALDSLVKNIADAKEVIANIKKIGEIDTFAASTMDSKRAKGFEKMMNQLFAQLYLDFGDVCARSGNKSDKEVQSGFVVLEKANVEIFNVIEFSEQIIVTGLENGGDASMLACESVDKSIYLAKHVFIQSLDKFAKIVFERL